MRRLIELLLGVGLIVASFYLVAENLRYGRNGVKTYGTVVRVVNRVEVDDGSFSHTQSPVVEYQPVGSKEKRSFRSSTWASSLFVPKTGSRVRVVYLPNEPENARIPSVWHWILPLIFAGFGVGSLLGKLAWDSDRSWGFRWNSD